MVTRRRGKFAAGLACLLLASGFIWSAGAVRAQEGPSEAQILNALKPPPKTRSLSSDQARRGAEERQFIDSLKTGKTRSLSADQREKVATIAKDKPSIDLEIYFNFDSADITPKALPDLQNLGRALSSSDLQGSTFMVGGYTDAKGGDDYNQRLSERRSAAVKQFLVKKFGIPDENLLSVGYGKEHLKNTSDPFAGENRRVQIVNLASKDSAQK